MTDTLAILQARTTSHRLPGKVLEDVAGEPLLYRMIERVQRAFKIDRIVVATSTDASDDAVEAIARRINVDCFRGSLDDVLDRYYRAAVKFEARHIVRLTADCVLTDPALIDDVIARYCLGDHEYCSNVTERTFPIGLDVEVFSMAALTAAWEEAYAPYDREHVTPFLRRDPVRFRHGVVQDALDHAQLRWVVDEPADLEFVRAVFDALYPYGPAFSREDILELLEEHPELAAINAGCGADPRPRTQRMAA